MKIFRLPEIIESNCAGQCRLGTEELGSRSLYMVYGRLRPKETGRELRTGDEEVVCVIKGELSVGNGKSSFTVNEGEAFYSSGETFILDNHKTKEAVYVTSGYCLKKAGDSEVDADNDGPEVESKEDSETRRESRPTPPVEEEAKEETKV